MSRKLSIAECLSRASKYLDTDTPNHQASIAFSCLAMAQTAVQKDITEEIAHAALAFVTRPNPDSHRLLANLIAVWQDLPIATDESDPILNDDGADLPG